MGDLLKFSRGTEVELGSVAVVNGNVRVATDTKSLFFDLDGARLEVTDFISVANKDALDGVLAPVAKKFYYVESENTLYKYDATTSSWKALVAKLDSDDIVDNLESTDSTKVLSANQGRQLKEDIDGLIWSGTRAEYEVAKTNGEIKEGQLVNITDDDDITVIDSTVTETSNNPVSSAGIYSALSGKANTADPAFTGVPTAPTAAENTNTTQIATTAFVMTAISTVLNKMVTSLDSTATDEEIPTAKAVWDRISELQTAMQGMMGEYTSGDTTGDTSGGTGDTGSTT